MRIERIGKSFVRAVVVVAVTLSLAAPVGKLSGGQRGALKIQDTQNQWALGVLPHPDIDRLTRADVKATRQAVMRYISSLAEDHNRPYHRPSFFYDGVVLPELV